MTHSRQAVVWSATVGIALGLAMWSPQPVAAENAKPSAKTSSSAPASSSATTQIGVQATPPASAEKIVHTFQDSAKMEEFAKIWQQRQGILLRMSVLQAYWNEEKTLLEQLNHTLSSQYALDVAKNYRLDDTRRVLIEQPPAPASSATSQSVPPTSQNSPSPKP